MIVWGGAVAGVKLKCPWKKLKGERKKEKVASKPE